MTTSDLGHNPHLPAADDVWWQVESLDANLRGVAHRADGSAVHIDGALPNETVQAQVFRRKKGADRGQITALQREWSQRVRPACPHFGLHAGACSGCKMQHIGASAQVAIKQRQLEETLFEIGQLKPDNLLRPLEGPAWEYRYRARLSVRDVLKKGVVLVGFHERKAGYVADMAECRVLPKPVSDLLLPLRDLIASLEARQQCPQIEVACGESADGREIEVIALVLRHLVPLADADLAQLRAFAQTHPRVQWWLQPKGLDTVAPLEADNTPLRYVLPDFGITMPYRPTDFTQVNPHINRVMVARALRLLAPQPQERVIDWFCGLGNFTLPLATCAAEVMGVEGSEALVARANENLASNRAAAEAQGLRRFAPASFVARDLFQMTPQMLMDDGHADRWLIDPPREGALALVTALAALQQDAALRGDWRAPRRIVYVSCNPESLARDSGILVQQAGYRCSLAGLINMFPHTAHSESMAVFDLV